MIRSTSSVAYALLIQRQNGAQSQLIHVDWYLINLTATHYNNPAWGDCFTLLPHTRACLKSSSKDSESTWGILKAVELGEITATPKLMIIESKILCKSSTAFSTVNCLLPRCGVMMIGSLSWQHWTLPTRDASISQATSIEIWNKSEAKLLQSRETDPSSSCRSCHKRSNYQCAASPVLSATSSDLNILWSCAANISACSNAHGSPDNFHLIPQSAQEIILGFQHTPFARICDFERISVHLCFDEVSLCCIHCIAAVELRNSICSEPW